MRLCIFSFFDKEGYVDDYVVYLLSELSTVANRLIIVVNGLLDEKGQKIFANYTQEVYIRDNVGYDAGAYKDILCNRLSQEELTSFDEVILCNDTFFGPFIPMSDIFENMKCRDCDIWGLNGYFDWIFPHIQSYFLVFKDRIIKTNLLVDYFKTMVDENTKNVNYVYCQFENGLYDYMVRQHGMKAATYVKNNHRYDLYKDSYLYLQELQIPILKKKAFGSTGGGRNNSICTLSYIKYNTGYNTELILKSIERIYGITLNASDIKGMEHYQKPKSNLLPWQVSSVTQVENFIRGEEFYIYGAGRHACNIYWRFARDSKKFCGFIVSDGSKDANTLLFGYSVSKLSDVKNVICSKKIIMSMSAEFAEEALKNFSDSSNVIRIF